ncbi:MAG: hypothetical protein HY819_20360 [Acidobacteria bacterium]|nr:hypothetical protein [Acidobacteriota bacterium]
MIIWEYRIEKVKLSCKSSGKTLSSELDIAPAEELLIEAGQRGWELVDSWRINPNTSTNVEIMYTFKRPKEEKAQYEPLWK